MRYAKIENNSISNGPGIRVVLWCQGCSLKCKGCHNPETWDPKDGQQFTSKDIDRIIKLLEPEWIDGITLSGGHPLEYYNINECTNLCKELKEKLPNKTIWLYTGLLWENIKDLPILQYIDVVVDGPYIESERNISLPYCGSNNQRVIDVHKSLLNNNIMLYNNGGV